MNAPSKSSVVLVAGSALDDLQDVMDKVDTLGQDMQMIPYAIVLLVEDKDKNRILNTTRHNDSPPVVSNRLLNTWLTAMLTAVVGFLVRKVKTRSQK